MTTKEINREISYCTIAHIACCKAGEMGMARNYVNLREFYHKQLALHKTKN